MRALRVVIVSPGAVPEERDAVETVLRHVAQGVGRDRNLRFDVARWETAAYAGFHLEGGQGICDEVLEIAQADIVIAIFWARFGTHYKEGKVNTEHEIEQAVRAWEDKGSPMPMFFFREAPPPNFDAATLEQMLKVRQYHDRMAPPRGI